MDTFQNLGTYAAAFIVALPMLAGFLIWLATQKPESVQQRKQRELEEWRAWARYDIERRRDAGLMVRPGSE